MWQQDRVREEEEEERDGRQTVKRMNGYGTVSESLVFAGRRSWAGSSLKSWIQQPNFCLFVSFICSLFFLSSCHPLLSFLLGAGSSLLILCSHPSLHQNIHQEIKNEKQNIPFVPLGGSSPFSRRLYPLKKAPWPPAVPPAVSAGRFHSGELLRPSAPAPPFRGSAGSFSAQGWRRHPTEEKSKKTVLFFPF